MSGTPLQKLQGSDQNICRSKCFSFSGFTFCLDALWSSIKLQLWTNPTLLQVTRFSYPNFKVTLCRNWHFVQFDPSTVYRVQDNCHKSQSQVCNSLSDVMQVLTTKKTHYVTTMLCVENLNAEVKRLGVECLRLTIHHHTFPSTLFWSCYF